MIDHLENSTLKNKLSNLQILILDEADRLLEQGFRQELIKIIGALPKRNITPRQTLLFSATVPAQVHQIASIALLPSFSFITTISAGDAGTHSRVPQNFLLASLNDTFPITLATIRSEMNVHGAATKIMCFLPTARATGLAAALFKRLNIGMDVFEIHSRKSQFVGSPLRVAACADCEPPSQESTKRRCRIFQNCDGRRSVLVRRHRSRNGLPRTFFAPRRPSISLTARSMQQGVTTVLQVGLPANAEQYIHRLGRTARAGAQGSGILVLTPFEQFFLNKKEIKALSVSPHPETNTVLRSDGAVMNQARMDVRSAMGTVDDETKAQFYSATLGFYKVSFSHSIYSHHTELMKSMKR